MWMVLSPKLLHGNVRILLSSWIWPMKDNSHKEPWKDTEAAFDLYQEEIGGSPDIFGRGPAFLNEGSRTRSAEIWCLKVFRPPQT